MALEIPASSKQGLRHKGKLTLVCECVWAWYYKKQNKNKSVFFSDWADCTWVASGSWRNMPVTKKSLMLVCLSVCVWSERLHVYCVVNRNVAPVHSLISRARKQLLSTDCVLAQCEDMLQPCSLLMSRSNVVINMVLSTTESWWYSVTGIIIAITWTRTFSTSSPISSTFLQVEVIGAMIKPAHLIPGRFHWAARPLLLWGCQLWSGIRRTLSPPQRTSMSKCQHKYY